MEILRFVQILIFMVTVKNAQAAGLPVRQVFELIQGPKPDRLKKYQYKSLINLKTNSSMYELHDLMESNTFYFDKRTKFHPQQSFVEYMPDKRDHSATADYEYEAPMLLF